MKDIAIFLYCKSEISLFRSSLIIAKPKLRIVLNTEKEIYGKDKSIPYKMV